MAEMVDMWAVGPESRDPARLERIRQEAERVQAEVAILQAGDESTCRVCGSADGLTDEHTPSRKAGNLPRLIEVTVDVEASEATDEIAWQTQLRQGGARAATLCKTCNNSTGRRYNPAYIRLVQQCGEWAVQENAGRTCNIALDLHPQRAVKQGLTSILATSQAGIIARHGHLRELLLDPESVRSLVPLRLWLYLRANSGGRNTGVACTVAEETGVGRVLAEFSFWPLGWLLTFDDVPVDGAVDVSSWFEIGYHDQRRFCCAVPCQWAHLAYPADFRSRKDILAQAARRSAAADG
jgi:hypothetical protein